MRARRAGTPPRQGYRRGGGPARLGTVVSCPTARAARPGAQRRDMPENRSAKCEVLSAKCEESPHRVVAPDRLLQAVVLDLVREGAHGEVQELRRPGAVAAGALQGARD